MSIRDMKGKVEDKIPVRRVVVSVFDKTGLEELIPGIIRCSSGVQFLSTGGTHGRITQILGSDADRYLTDIGDYTGSPEMEGGLVKTLHPKIHSGILAERNNPDHENFLLGFGADFIDLVVVNLYNFAAVTVADASIEKARGHIDIGGPAMLRAAAKNFPGCAVVCRPEDYKGFLMHLEANAGCTTFNYRVGLARPVFITTGNYDKNIGQYLSGKISQDLPGIRAAYGLDEEE